MIHLDHLFHFDDAGRTALTTADDHAFDMICQFLLTAPLERVNRPDFGTPLATACFEGASQQLADVTEFIARAGLQRWLGDVIEIVELTVVANGNVLLLDLKYRVRGNATVLQKQRQIPRGAGGLP